MPAASYRLPSAGPAPGENTSLHLINMNGRAPGFRTWISIFLLLGVVGAIASLSDKQVSSGEFQYALFWPPKRLCACIPFVW